MNTLHDALIIGGGPAGATAARLLSRAGWSVAMVEKTSFPRRKVCGEFISATSLPLLSDRGIEDVFSKRAGPRVQRVGLFAGKTVLTSAMPFAARTGWGRALGRDHLDSILLDAAAAAGADLWQPWKAVGLAHTDRGYRCRIAKEGDEEELAARIVIMAKGSWEKSRLDDVTYRTPARFDLLAFKAHFRDSRLPDDLMPLIVFPGGYGGMVHSDDGRVSLSCCIRRDVLERCRASGEKASDAVLRHILKHCEGVRAALDGAETDGAWLSAGPIRPGIRTSSVDGLFFVGNIAGEAHPIVAEGISMAMQSAWLLCRHLIENEDAFSQESLREVGRAYRQDWRAAFATRIHAAAAFAHLAMRKQAAAAAPLLKLFPEVLTFGAKLSGKAKEVVHADPHPLAANAARVLPLSGGG
jgi:flavin-dependent dehydrogenase